MARCPFASWRPIPASEPAIIPTQVVFHTMVVKGGLPSCDAYFRSGNSGGIESHFGVGGPWEGAQYDGAVWQWRDTELQADAQYHANVRAVSIETADAGNPSNPWSAKQLDTLIRLGRWLRFTHNIPARICPAWDASGFGWHTMWGAPSNWTPVSKTCPGDHWENGHTAGPRITQLKTIVLPKIFAATYTGEDPNNVFDAEAQDFLRSIRDTIIGASPFEDRLLTINKVRADLAAVKNDLAAAKADLAALRAQPAVDPVALASAILAAMVAQGIVVPASIDYDKLAAAIAAMGIPASVVEAIRGLSFKAV